MSACWLFVMQLTSAVYTCILMMMRAGAGDKAGRQVRELALYLCAAVRHVLFELHGARKVKARLGYK